MQWSDGRSFSRRLKSNPGAQHMKRRNLTAGVIAFGACLVIADVSTPSARLYAAEPQSFSEDILPIFKGRCVSCHQSGGPGDQEIGLELTPLHGLVNGNQFRRIVAPLHPEDRHLM